MCVCVHAGRGARGWVRAGRAGQGVGGQSAIGRPSGHPPRACALRAPPHLARALLGLPLPRLLRLALRLLHALDLRLLRLHLRLGLRQLLLQHLLLQHLLLQRGALLHRNLHGHALLHRLLLLLVAVAG